RVSRTICAKFPLGSPGPRKHADLFVPSSCLLCAQAGIGLMVERIVGSIGCVGYEVNIRLTHPTFQNTMVFFGAIWYNIPHETDPATIALYLHLGAGQCDEHHPLLPTNGGADEASLY